MLFLIIPSAKGDSMRIFLFSFFILLFITGCADSVDYTLGDETAAVGFWYGLWHGMIAVVAFVVSLFDEKVAVYAVYNNGAWYDFGFVLGFLMVWGGSHKIKCKSKVQKQKEKEWEEVGQKVEKKVMRKLKEWAEDENDSESTAEWEEIGDKVEKKLKRKIREWAEKE